MNRWMKMIIGMTYKVFSGNFVNDLKHFPIILKHDFSNSVMDGPTDKASYRDAWMHLKRALSDNHNVGW